MSKQKRSKQLPWWHLVILGIAFTTGTGFFLGSSIAIQKSGFLVLGLFLLAAFGTFFVFDALAKMIANDSQKGSFRTYSKKAFGHWAGFSHGWLYWISEILILGSQLTAIGLFAQFWFPDIPLWVFASIFATLGVGIVLLGTKGFETMEDLLAVIKVAAIIMFIGVGSLTLFGVIGQDPPHMHTPDHYFSQGVMGMWTGLIFVFFAFAGIEVMGIMAAQLENPKDAPKAGRIMVMIVTVLFLASISLALLLAPLDSFSAQESPFVTALKDIKFTSIVYIFNGVLIIAGFSSLVASLYAVTSMMYTIAKDGDAPKFFAQKGKRNIPYQSLGLTVVGMIISIIAALLLPKKVYEYITTAGGLMLIFSWLFILMAARKLLKLTTWDHIKSITAIILILLTITGTMFDASTRPGLFVSLVFIILVGIVTLIMRKKWSPRHENEDHLNWQRWKP
ncbi:amino acid permease [Caldalkalibacillus salinus]|uniref:amino acid permease n=1 Tax=Caldalkalibacillus salinus TaxID=2803787 RepID=UPI0019203D70|nr:amino acid permease [Caldalkalibacillus salinus]